MKTKIIYISGGDAFPPAEVKGAMDTIRDMLKLGADTIIFGIPVDSDNVEAGAVSDTDAFVGPLIDVREHVAAEGAPVTENTKISETGSVAQKSAEIPVLSEKPAPTRKTRKTKAAAIDTSLQNEAETGAAEHVKNKPMAPILSVIGGVTVEPAAQEDDEDEIPAATLVLTAPASTGVTTTILELNSDDEPGVSALKTAIYDLSDADDDLDDTEIKSIEDIFADIAPIAEDRPIDLKKYEEEDDAEAEHESMTLEVDTEIDATLSKLASEFAHAQTDTDDVPAKAAEPAKGGRIGKLKNILPFKKKDKADGGVLGDLFGWAGIAANDDTTDFEMPEFFRVRN